MEWYVLAILGAVFTGFAALTHKKTVKNIEPLDFSAVLAIINLLISLPLLLKIDYSIIDNKAIFLMVIGSLLATIGFVFMSKAIKHMELSSSEPLYTFGPAIIAFLAFIFLGETLNLIQLSGIFLVMTGAYILELEHHDWKEPFRVIKKSKYVHYIFISMIVYGFCSLVDRVLLSRSGEYAMNALHYLAIMHVFIALNFIFLIFLFSNGYYSIRDTFKSTGFWIILMGVFTVTYRILQNKAVETAPNVAFVSVIKRLSIFIPIIIGGKLFHEHNLKKKTISSIIMLLGSVLIILF